MPFRKPTGPSLWMMVRVRSQEAGDNGEYDTSQEYYPLFHFDPIYMASVGVK